MKFSYQWLTTLVDLKGLLPVDVANAFHRAGIEVESVMPLVKASHITTGLVKQRTMIEGSDHLSKVLIDTGRHGQRTIVCGASNIREGQKVLVALPGAILPKLTIQESVIKGVTSQGMVCALNELGLDAKFLTATQLEGIEILDAKTQVGDDTILETLGLTDTIIELKLLANRPDLWAMEGIAMEVAALLNRSLIVQEKPKAIQLKPSRFKWT
jgi:phenylalanyl-tRNA synthetase beta chain